MNKKLAKMGIQIIRWTKNWNFKNFNKKNTHKTPNLSYLVNRLKIMDRSSSFVCQITSNFKCNKINSDDLID